jgi:hypothetical protein
MTQRRIAIIVFILVVIFLRRAEGLRRGLGQAFADGRALRTGPPRSRALTPHQRRQQSTTSHGDHTGSQEYNLTPVHGVIAVQAAEGVGNGGEGDVFGSRAKRVIISQKSCDS